MGERARRAHWMRAASVATLVVLAGIAGIGARATTPSTSRDWPMPGQDYANSRAAVGSMIRRANVDRLQEAYTATTPGLSTLSTAPIVVDGTVYFEGGSGVVVAADAQTGTIRWSSPAT